MEEKLNKKISCLEASTFHIQGNDMLGKELFASAISDYVVATKYYLTGNDEQNGRIVLGNILKALRLVTKNSYIEDQVQVSIDDLIKDLEGRNVYGRYSKDVSDIKKECKAALLREPPQAIAKV